MTVYLQLFVLIRRDNQKLTMNLAALLKKYDDFKRHKKRHFHRPELILFNNIEYTSQFTLKPSDNHFDIVTPLVGHRSHIKNDSHVTVGRFSSVRYYF